MDQPLSVLLEFVLLTPAFDPSPLQAVSDANCLV